MNMKRINRPLLLSLSGALALGAATVGEAKSAKQPPNILFMVMDDVGIDQMQIFGYGGEDPPQTPNMNAIALAGVRFRNSWSSPTCSPSRAAFFDGRYNIRTRMYAAISQADLANSAMSPYEYSTPKLLRTRGYVSGVFGKMHLSGSERGPANMPFGNDVMRALGWDRFEGILDGGPAPIDTTAGGVSPVIHEDGSGVYGCGFVPNKTSDPVYGADTGACYLSTGSCEELSTATHATPGKTCLERGGILDPGQACQASIPSKLNFDKENAYYTANWVLNYEDGATSTLPPANAQGRGYASIQEADRAIAWIKQQPTTQPWMASIGFRAIHEPVQPPPSSLLPAGSVNTDGYSCEDTEQNRILATQMLEAMDHEMGRVLVETGLARYASDGSLDYHPEQTNTVVVITSDNGTWSTSVREPFDPARAKGTPYQTGVWVPEIVAGPMVKKPGREVSHMTNGTDLFSLFGEVAGIDVQKVVPKSHQLDSVKMMPYLTNPGQGAIRTNNYTMFGNNNLRAPGAEEYPCVVPSMNTCTTIFPTLGVCEDQSGIWYGPGGVAEPEVLTSCCEANAYRASQGEPEVMNLLTQSAIRNKHYKLVQTELENCSGGAPNLSYELYRINEAVPDPKLDWAADNLLDGRPLTANDQRNYKTLLRKIDHLENSVVDCPGDGNLDAVVNQADLDNWSMFSLMNQGRSSWYDFNLDGLTNDEDYQIILDNFGNRCKPPKKGQATR